MDSALPSETTSKEELRQLSTLIERTNIEDPDPADVSELKAFLANHPEVWSYVGDISVQARALMIKHLDATPAFSELLSVGLRDLETQLGRRRGVSLGEAPDRSGCGLLAALLDDPVPLLERDARGALVSMWHSLGEAIEHGTVEVSEGDSNTSASQKDCRQKPASDQYRRATDQLGRIGRVDRG